MSHEPSLTHNGVLATAEEDKGKKVLPNEQEGQESKDAEEGTATTFDKGVLQVVLKEKYAKAASEGMGSYATLMYENEGGIAPFYAGVVTSAVQSATEKALYFFAYTFLKNG